MNEFNFSKYGHYPLKRIAKEVPEKVHSKITYFLFSVEKIVFTHSLD